MGTGVLSQTGEPVLGHEPFLGLEVLAGVLDQELKAVTEPGS